MRIKKIEEKENLERLINEGVSYEFIGRNYGVTGNAVKKAAKRLGIILPQKRSINPNEHFNKGNNKKRHYCLNCGKDLSNRQSKFCDLTCQHDYYYKEYIKRWKDGKENGAKGFYDVSNYIRRYLYEKHNYKCEKCGWGEVNERTGNIPLQIHHIDGDCTNNKEENLQLLCPNCHSLTENFGSRNKNCTRIDKRKRY